MVVKSMMTKMKVYPRPHHKEYAYFHGLETGVANQAVQVPIIAYDEGLGTASDYKANPNNAAFVEHSMPNCYPNSFINNIYMELRFTMTKACLETDKIHNVRCAFMVINTSFLEDYTALDEISTLDTSEVLELQTEATDRQAGPLYNGIDTTPRFTGSANTPSSTPFLASQILECVAWNTLNYYDALHYMTIAGKLKHIQRGLKWFTLSRSKPIKKFRLFISGKSKRMVPYSQTSVMTYVPSAGTKEQYAIVSDTTNVSHISVDFGYRYNEWNQDYDMKLV